MSRPKKSCTTSAKSINDMVTGWYIVTCLPCQSTPLTMIFKDNVDALCHGFRMKFQRDHLKHRIRKQPSFNLHIHVQLTYKKTKNYFIYLEDETTTFPYETLCFLFLQQRLHMHKYQSRVQISKHRNDCFQILEQSILVCNGLQKYLPFIYLFHKLGTFYLYRSM